MILGLVIGSVWASHKQPGTEGLKIQLVQPLTGELRPQGRPLAAFDSVGAGPGELVYYVLQYEATLPFPDRPLTPIDATILGIIDEVHDQAAAVLDPSPDNPFGSGKAGAAEADP